jgi:hypothetical protein
MKRCSAHTCTLPSFVFRKDDPSIGYCMAHGMEYAYVMKSKEESK